MVGRVAKVPTLSLKEFGFFYRKGREIESRRRRPFQTQGREGGRKEHEILALLLSCFGLWGEMKAKASFVGIIIAEYSENLAHFPTDCGPSGRGEIHQRKVQANLLEKSFKCIDVQNGRQSMKGN